MRKYPEKPENKEYSHEECRQITMSHRKSVMEIMDIFYGKLKKLGENHDKDKETPENLEKYTYLLNHQDERAINKEWERIHNHNNTHHVEGFLDCKEPKLQDLVEMVCDNVATAIARDAKYGNIFEENKKRYINKGLSESLAEVCANTFVDLWNTMHLKKGYKIYSRLRYISKKLRGKFRGISQTNGYQKSLKTQ